MLSMEQTSSLELFHSVINQFVAEMSRYIQT